MTDQLRTKRRVRAIAFDLDFTLSFYPATIQDVLKQSLHRVGEPVSSIGDPAAAAIFYDSIWVETERASSSLHETRSRIWHRLLALHGHGTPDLADRLATAYDEVRRETGVRLFDGVEALLSELRSSYRLGLLTNGSTEMQWEKIDDLGIRSAFDTILVAGDIGIYKPDPRIFQQLSEALDVPAEETLFVGDSFESDILGAAGIGMKTVWIRTDVNPIDASESAVDPDHILSTVCDLREVLV